MFLKFLHFFTRNNAKNLEKQGTELLNVFTRTAEGLKSLNSKISARKQYHTNQISAHRREHEHLVNQEAKNVSIIEKINLLLSQ